MNKKYCADLLPADLIENIPNGSRSPEELEAWIERAGIALTDQIIDIVRNNETIELEKLDEAIEKQGKIIKLFAFGLHVSLQKRKTGSASAKI